MEKQPNKKTKNEQMFDQIQRYSYTIHKKAKNVKVKRTYKGDSTLRIVNDGVKLLYEGRFATSWLTRDDLNSINNVAAYKIILEILADLQLNNPLWRRKDPKTNGRWNSQISDALKVLEKHGILYPFRGTDVYYVVPTKLSCGEPLKVAFAWLEYVKTFNIKPDMIGELDIKRLKNPKDKTYIKDFMEEFRENFKYDEDIQSEVDS